VGNIAALAANIGKDVSGIEQAGRGDLDLRRGKDIFDGRGKRAPDIAAVEELASPFPDRAPDGRAFRYSARYTPEELERVAAVNGIRQLLGSEYASLHLSYLVEAVSTQDEKLLDELQALVERQRAQLKKGAPE